ncbi:MAG: dihydropteroate synthase, partial [Methanomicrobiales archaeon]|nr:dihydropteroate synthase [Methanomicrobiales archaeon]
RATGPGSIPITPALERERIQSVLKELEGTCTLSVDTIHPQVLEAALKYEIHAVNDISGLAHPQMQKMVAESGLPAILMAARERPGDAGSVEVVKTALALIADRCTVAEIDNYVLDPGIGLWTPDRTFGDNWELCRRFSEFSLFNRPLLAAISRKSFLGDLLKKPVTERKYASIALNVLLMVQGAAMIRTHDVQETADAIRVFQKMERFL